MLRENKIDFLMRLPARRTLYKNMIREHWQKIEVLENSVQFGERILFVKYFIIDLYGKVGYAYMILDPSQKLKDLSSIVEKYNEKSPEKMEDEKNYYDFIEAGIFMLINSKLIPEDEVLSAYYTRQTVEQIFGFAKSDLDLLPIRCHNEQIIRGYLFLQFILLTIFIEIKKLLKNKYTVEQALMITRSLKCKVYSNEYLVQDLTKSHKEIFELC